MPRKGHTPKRDVLADPIYKDKIVTKLINNIMLDGKKSIARKIVYGAFDKIAERSGKPALEVFTEAPVLFDASRISPARRSSIVFSPLDREKLVSQRSASACLLSGLTSIGT